MSKKYVGPIVGVLFFCLAYMLTGHFMNNNGLKNSVEKANKQCPVSLGVTGEWTSITYTDGVVKMLYTMNEEMFDIDALSEQSKRAIISGMINENSKKMFRLLIKSDANLRIVYKGKDSGKEAVFDFTPAELKELLDNPEPTNEEKIQAAIDVANAQMPMDTGTGVVMTEMKDRGDDVVYMAKVENEAALKEFSDSIENVKENLRCYLSMMGPSDKVFFKTIAEAGKSLGYIYYTDKSDETVDVIFSNEELKEIVKQ